MPDTGTDTIVTSIATANDDHVLALGRDVRRVGVFRVEKGFGIGMKEIHGEVDTVDLSVGKFQVSWPGGA